MSSQTSPPAPGVDNSRMTLTPWTKPTLTILLVGETGVGKTAFLDLLSNVCAGRRPEQFVKAHIESNENGGSSLGSQTRLPSLYRIACANGHQVRVLDTPGLADTRGTDFDDQHKQSIAQAISSQIEVIDSVIVLANGTNTRLGVVTQYALTVIAGMFPQSIVDNIGFLFTMVANPFQFNFKREGLPVALRNAKIWTMDNPLVGWFLYHAQLQLQPPPDEFILEDMQNTVNLTYNKTMTMLNNFFKWQDERTVQPTKAIDDLYRMSTRIEASIANVVTQLTEIDRKKIELAQLETTITGQKEASYISYPLIGIQQVNKDFQTIIDKSYYQLEATTEPHDICFETNCHQNCYEDGSWLGDNGMLITLHSSISIENTFYDNTLLRDAGLTCHKCGHSSKVHERTAKVWVFKPDVRTTLDPAAKARYEAAKQKEGESAALKLQVNDTIKALEEAAESYEDDLGALCAEFNELALSGSFLRQITTAIALLQMRHDTMVQQGVNAESISRMSERIASMEKKKQVLEDSVAEHEEELKGDGGFITTGGANVKSVAL